MIITNSASLQYFVAPTVGVEIVDKLTELTIIISKEHYNAAQTKFH